MQNIRLITLDLADTLWCAGPTLQRAETCLHVWLTERCPATAAQYPPAALRALRLEVERLHPHLTGDMSATHKTAIRLALRRAGDPDRHADAAFEVFWTALNDIECFDDVLPALRRLKSRYTLAAVNDGSADVERAGLGRYFDFSLSTREAGYRKPARNIFRAACGLAGVRPEQALHAGDDIQRDVHGALAAGLHAAWVNRNARSLRTVAPPAFMVPHLGILADRMAV